MAKTFHEFLCDGHVTYEYFKKEGICSIEHIEAAIKAIMTEFPNHFLYIGITSNPCGRWTLNYNTALPPQYQRNEGLEVNEVLLTERAHQDDYEHMFVICIMLKEPLIRGVEIETIALAKSIDVDRILNTKRGGNGNLQKGASFYFLYVCITKTRPINS